MSLEEALAAHAVALNENTAILKIMVGKAKGVAGGTPSGDDGEDTKKTRRTGKAADASGGDTVDIQPIKDKLADWLGEFAKDADKDNPDGAHPEVKARKAALAETLKKLGISKLGQFNDPAPFADKTTREKELGRLTKWFEKKKDEGRLTQDESDGDDGDDDL